MTHIPVVLPAINANDEEAELVKWLCENKAMVKAGDPVVVVETTKTTVEVTAPADGYCIWVAAGGTTVKVGSTLAVIAHSPDAQVDSASLHGPSHSQDKGASRWTKKAELVAKKLGVDIVALAERLGRSVSEADVLSAQKPTLNINDLVDDAYGPQRRQERVLLIGGGGGGGVITLDAISRTRHQRAVGVLDNNADLHGKFLMGVPVLGGNDQVHALWQSGFFDAAIVVVTGSIDQRQAIFKDLIEKGIPVTNVIDPSVDIRSNVQLGKGNLIMANGFLAACVKIGDNNFLASHVCIEHHSIVGSHCTIGPRTATSGGVVIGDRVKFGMGVLVEPYLTIGDRALLPSGSIITMSVPPDSVVKLQGNQMIRAR